MKLNLLTAALSLLVVNLLPSCEHKDLCLHHDEHALRCKLVVNAEYDLSVDADYHGRTDSILYPAEPEGLRMLVYNSDYNHSINNLEIHGGSVILSEGQHSLLFYNNDTEYIVFDDLSSSVTARATTRSRNRATYIGNSYFRGNEVTVNQPDMLFGAYVEDYYSRLSITSDTVNVTLRPFVYSYLIDFNVTKGINSVAYSRGAIAGMASSVYINNGVTSDDVVTVLFDSEVKGNSIEGIVRTFGAPSWPINDSSTRIAPVYAVNLELRLVDGSTLTFDYDVSDQVANQPHGGVIVIDDIELPEVENSGTAAPFEVDVTEWGPAQSIILGK